MAKSKMISNLIGSISRAQLFDWMSLQRIQEMHFFLQSDFQDELQGSRLFEINVHLQQFISPANAMCKTINSVYFVEDMATNWLLLHFCVSYQLLVSPTAMRRTAVVHENLLIPISMQIDNYIIWRMICYSHKNMIAEQMYRNQSQ